MEMGIGPVYSVPKLLKSHNMSVEDIDLWESLMVALQFRLHIVEINWVFLWIS